MTEEGQSIAGDLPVLGKSQELTFQLAIEQFDPFRKMYEKLKNQRLPAEDILQDQFGQLGVHSADCEKAAQIFDANARYTGIIRELSGTEFIIPIEQLLEDSSTYLKEASTERQEVDLEESNLPETEQSDTSSVIRPEASLTTNAPSIHINLQIHINPDATPQQIDHIFASMRRHLYNREE